MKHTFLKISTIVLFASAIFSSCTKPETPEPVEEELITTTKLHITNSAGFDKTFSYKVEGGTGVAGGVTKDDIVLEPNKQYNVEITLLNESASPVENITEEVISENNDHLFLFQSAPATGAGSVTVDNGSKDATGNPFNQKVRFTTGAAGTGTLTLVLKHLPTNKNATTADAAGGSTDVEATFNVRLQ